MLAKILALIVTGMPGLQKLVMFAVLENIVTINELASFASDYSILLILAYFSTVGISGLVLTRVSKLNNVESRKFLSIAINYMAKNYYIYFLVLLFLFYIGVFFDLVGGVLFLFTWSAYQVVRHYCISKREYYQIILCDFSSLFLFIVLIFNLDDAFLCLSISYMFSIIFLLVNRYALNSGFNLGKDDKKITNNISLSNFLSSAVLLSLPAVVNYSNPSLSALIGYLLSFLLLVQLLPRGLSLYYVTSLSNSGTKIEIKEVLIRYNLYNITSIFMLCILSVIIYSVCSSYNLVSLLNVNGSKYYFFLLLLNIVVSSLTVPFTTLHLSIEKTSSMLFSSIIYSLFASVSIVFYVFNFIDVIGLLIFICFCSLLKLIILIFSSCKIVNEWSFNAK